MADTPQGPTGPIRYYAVEREAEGPHASAEEAAHYRAVSLAARRSIMCDLEWRLARRAAARRYWSRE